MTSINSITGTQDDYMKFMGCVPPKDTFLQTQIKPTTIFGSQPKLSFGGEAIIDSFKYSEDKIKPDTAPQQVLVGAPEYVDAEPPVEIPAPTAQESNSTSAGFLSNTISAPKLPFAEPTATESENQCHDSVAWVNPDLATEQKEPVTSPQTAIKANTTAPVSDKQDNVAQQGSIQSGKKASKKSYKKVSKKAGKKPVRKAGKQAVGAEEARKAAEFKKAVQHGMSAADRLTRSTQPEFRRPPVASRPVNAQENKEPENKEFFAKRWWKGIKNYYKKSAASNPVPPELQWKNAWDANGNLKTTR